MKAANPHAKAQRHLARAHPAFQKLIKLIGPCALRTHTDVFAMLVKAVVSQQISIKAAASISARLEQALAPAGLTPAGLRAASDELIQSCGISAPKRKTFRDILAHLDRESKLLDGLGGVDTDELNRRLLPIHGVRPRFRAGAPPG